MLQLCSLPLRTNFPTCLPGFCFVHYEDIRDAEDAIKDLDG